MYMYETVIFFQSLVKTFHTIFVTTKAQLVYWTTTLEPLVCIENDQVKVGVAWPHLPSVIINPVGLLPGYNTCRLRNTKGISRWR